MRVIRVGNEPSLVSMAVVAAAAGGRSDPVADSATGERTHDHLLAAHRVVAMLCCLLAVAASASDGEGASFLNDRILGGISRRTMREHKGQRQAQLRAVRPYASFDWTSTLVLRPLV